MMSDISLTVPILLRRYSTEQIDDLRSMLTTRDDNVILAPIHDVEQLSLRFDGSTIAGGLRYSTMVFRQICRILCSGLSNTIYDLSGARRRGIFEEQEYSSDEAIRLFNQVISLRFRLLMDRTLICDNSTGEIVGIAPSSYQRVGGLEILDMALDSLSSTDPTYEFQSAEVFGRVLVLRLVSNLSPLVAPLRDREETLRHGIYLTTADDGRDVLRCGQFFTRPGLTGSSWPFPRRPLSQRDSEFRMNLAVRITRMGSAEVESRRLQGWMEQACQTNLGVIGSPQEQDRRISSLESILSRRGGFSSSLTEALVQDTLYRGADENMVSTEENFRLTAWTRRTNYDLYCSAARMAADRSPESRLKMEKSAHQILNGRLVL